MLPSHIRNIRSAANMVQDRLDNALRLNTPQSQVQFETVQKWFEEKYPNYKWREWADKEKGAMR